MADATPKSYSEDPTLFLYTSLTAGSSHIITATSRLETILKANKIPFRALDVATDEKARMLWGRRAKGRKLPGLVKHGTIVGDLDEVEEWNEYGELKQQIGDMPSISAKPLISAQLTPSKRPSESATSAAPQVPTHKPSTEHIQISEPPQDQRKSSLGMPKTDDNPRAMAMRQAGAEAAQKAAQKKIVKPVSLGSDTSKALDDTPPAGEASLSNLLKDSATTGGTSGASVPTQVAAERVKRNEVDKITNPRSSTKEDERVDISREELDVQARRMSGTTEAKTSRSNETAPQAFSESMPQDVGMAQNIHRGSNMSETSEEEVANIEKVSTSTGVGDEAAERSSKRDPGKQNHADVTAADEGEQQVRGDAKPQDQGAKDGEEAGVSVGD